MKTLFLLPILLLSLLFGMAGVSVAAPEYRGANDILTTEDMTDPYFLSAVLQRCSGLYASITLYENVIPEKVAEMYGINAVKGYETAVTLLNKKHGASNNQSKVAESIRTYTSIYYNKMQESQTLTGSLFSKWVKTEFRQCNNLFTLF